MKAVHRAITRVGGNNWRLLGGILAVVLLLVFAQRLAIQAYWETHPEEYIKAVAQRPALEAVLTKVRTLQRNKAEADAAGRAQGINAAQ